MAIRGCLCGRGTGCGPAAESRPKLDDQLNRRHQRRSHRQDRERVREHEVHRLSFPAQDLRRGRSSASSITFINRDDPYRRSQLNGRRASEGLRFLRLCAVVARTLARDLSPKLSAYSPERQAIGDQLRSMRPTPSASWNNMAFAIATRGKLKN